MSHFLATPLIPRPFSSSSTSNILPRHQHVLLTFHPYTVGPNLSSQSSTSHQPALLCSPPSRTGSCALSIPLGQLEDIKQMITNSTELAAQQISICTDNPANLASYEWLTAGPASEILARALANLYWAFMNHLSFKTSETETNLCWQEIPPQCNCHSSDHVFGLCSVEQGVPRNLREGNEKFLEPHFSSQHLC